MSTWVKFHRKIEQWEWYTDANTFRVFFHLVLKANWEDGKWKGYDVKRGQRVTSPDKIATELGLTRQKVRTALDHLISTNEITIETTNKFTVITVANYESYQSKEKELTSKTPTNKQTNNKQANQQITTNKNNKELKEETKEIYRRFDHLSISNKEFDELNKTYTKQQIDDILDSIQNYRKNGSYSSLYLTAGKWLKKEYQNQQIKKVDTSKTLEIESIPYNPFNGGDK